MMRKEQKWKKGDGTDPNYHEWVKTIACLIFIALVAWIVLG